MAAADRPDLSGRIGFAAGQTVTVAEVVESIAFAQTAKAVAGVCSGLGDRAAGVWESVRQGVTRTARPFNRDKAREMLQSHWVCDAGPFLSDLRVGDLTDWRAGLLRTCRCYVEAGWLRDDVWAV